MKLLVLCTGNSCRSQMAEGWLCHYAHELNVNAEVVSAGIETHGLNPGAVKAMQKAGIDISKHTSDHVDRYLNTGITHLLSVCDHAAEHCPVFPENVICFHQSFEDPAKVTGSESQVEQAFDSVCADIRAYCQNLIQQLQHDV